MNELKDLHIHIERGPYTVQWIERFINQAVKMNLSEINLLEHSIRIKEFHPCFKEAREYSSYQENWFRGKENSAHTFEEYRALINEIRGREYPIKVNFGLEVCWFEQHADEIRNLVLDGFLDYVLGSVHWVDNWTFNQRKYQWKNKDYNHIYKRYFEMENSLIESGIFDIIAHPDLIRCHGLYPDYDLTETYHSLAENAVKNNVMIEMNTTRGRQIGINEAFFSAALAEGARFSTGSDAHCPEDVGKGIKEAFVFISRKLHSAGLQTEE